MSTAKKQHAKVKAHLAGRALEGRSAMSSIENWPFQEKKQESCWHDYRLLGGPGAVLGHGRIFRSLVPDLENHPDLWEKEVPFDRDLTAKVVKEL